VVAWLLLWLAPFLGNGTKYRSAGGLQAKRRPSGSELRSSR
jgi:hypothetical protein